MRWRVFFYRTYRRWMVFQPMALWGFLADTNHATLAEAQDRVQRSIELARNVKHVDIY